MGTAQYLSPEQARGAQAGPASDVYGLGMVAYECLAGRRAFEGENSVQIALRHINETPEPCRPTSPTRSGSRWNGPSSRIRTSASRTAPPC